MTGDNRKIAAILAADVVGYSRLMEDDEEDTLASLKITRNIFKRLAGQFGGFEFGSVGDSMMAQFPSAVNAVRCAQNIQKAVAIENESRPADRQIMLRMGINLGDVIEEEGNLYGDGVNMASRIQDLASPGGIYITGSVYEQVANKMNVGFEYSGQRYVKNINHPVEIYEVLAGTDKRPFRRISEFRKLLTNHPVMVLTSITVITVVLVLSAVWKYNNQGPQSAGTENQIAVLPFDNMSGDISDDFLGQGISEDILNLLAQIRDLKVVARTSSFQPRLQELDIREIGRQLGADYVLDGSVRRDGDHIMIVAQLNDARTGTNLMSERYERSTSDAFTIQREIAERVVKALRLELSVDFSMDPLKRPTENIDAYDYYIQARSFLEGTETEKSLEKAEHFFRRALEFDPDFGLAYAGLCTTLVHQVDLRRTSNVLPAAEDACNQADKQAPGSYLVHVAMGELYKIKGENDNALREFKWAVDHSNDDIDARLGIAEVYDNKGDEEAADLAFRDAIEINPGYSRAYRLYGSYLMIKGRYDDAIGIYQRLVELEPVNMGAYSNLGTAYLFDGDFEQATNVLRKVVSQNPNAAGYANFGLAYYYLGRFKDAVPLYHAALELLPDAYYLWGNLGNALLQLPDKQEQTREAYKQALALTGKQLEINENQGVVYAYRASYCARLNDLECAASSINKALQLADSDLDVHYNAALTYLELGMPGQAAMHMERAEKLGFSPKLLNADPLLAPLHVNGSPTATIPERVDQGSIN